MGFIDMLHNIEGYVTIQADGVFLERFLTVCTRRNLDIWNIRHMGESRLTADMSLSSFRVIRSVCRRTRTHLAIVKRRGLPFLLHRYRKRKLALLGLVLTLVFLWYTSGHIMGITVFGNNRIPTDTILDHLSRSGVSLGKTTDGIDSSHIRNRMMRDLEDLAWIGINVNGSRVYVEVVERLEKEPGVDMKQPCHLVASKDGVIDVIEARNGQTMVKVNSGVREGDVLVSGVMDADTQGFRYVHAYGEVFAKTDYALSRDYPLEYDEPVDTGEQSTRYSLRLLQFQLPLFWGTDAPYAQYAREESQQEYRLPIDRLPSLMIQKEIYKEQFTEHKTRTSAQALEQGVEELTAELKQSLPDGAEIRDTEVSHTLTERGSLLVTVTLHCRENIAKEVPIESEDAPLTISE